MSVPLPISTCRDVRYSLAFSVGPSPIIDTRTRTYKHDSIHYLLPFLNVFPESNYNKDLVLQ